MTCQAPRCLESLEGKRRGAKYCSSACAERARYHRKSQENGDPTRTLDTRNQHPQTRIPEGQNLGLMGGAEEILAAAEAATPTFPNTSRYRYIYEGRAYTREEALDIMKRRGVNT